MSIGKIVLDLWRRLEPEYRLVIGVTIVTVAAVALQEHDARILLIGLGVVGALIAACVDQPWG